MSPAERGDDPKIVFIDSRSQLPGWAYRIINGAAKAFPGRVIVVVPRTEHVISHISGVSAVSSMSISGLPQTLGAFRERYVHLSTAPEEYERSCFERFLILDAVMAKFGLERVWHLDIDALPLTDLARIETAELIRDPNFWALMSYESIPADVGSSVSAGNALLTSSAVREFVTLVEGEFFDGLLPQLRNFYSDRLANGLQGGVCDMTAWGVIAMRRRGDGILNSNTERPAGVLIPNSLYGLRTQLGRVGLSIGASDIKLFVSASQGVIRLDGHEKIPLGLIHFSGADKEVSRWLMSGRGLTLNGKVHTSIRGAYRVKRRFDSWLES